MQRISILFHYPELSFCGIQEVCLVQVDGPVECQELGQMIQS